MFVFFASFFSSATVHVGERTAADCSLRQTDPWTCCGQCLKEICRADWLPTENIVIKVANDKLRAHGVCVGLICPSRPIRHTHKYVCNEK